MIQKRTYTIINLIAIASVVMSSCAREDRFDTSLSGQETNTIFNITITKNTRSKTRGADIKTSYDTHKGIDTMDSDVAFGLVGMDNETNDVLVDNQPIYENNGVRMAKLVTSSLSSGSMKVTAFYPYTNSVNYHKDGSFGVEFTPNDIKQGPLVSDPVVMRCDQEYEKVELNFHHIANGIGFEVCDITDDDQLRGLMHIRKLVIHGMPTEGMFVPDGKESHWVPNAKRKDIVVFEGNSYVEYGVENSKFITEDGLLDSRIDGKCIYVVPEELKEGKHYAEIFFDVDPFVYDGIRYRGKTNASQIISLSGVVPDDMFEMGLHYTFVLGMNLGMVYRPIEFTSSVQDWEAKYSSRIMGYDNE
ncbi:MAG: hypothetical protein IJU24_02025 [Bacteroidaceae bacterium]|nr:hypothetical protein [Bacteroidaceae bacterium]